MYETIMSLPLFKGTSNDDISSFIEKVPVEFINAEAGDHIISQGEPGTHILFLLDGSVVVNHDLYGGDIIMSQCLSGGSVFMPENLFGLHTECSATVTAHTSCSLMKLKKAEYLSLLGMNRIFLINYLNYLSYKCQIRACVLSEFHQSSIQDFFRSLWYGLGERRAIYTEFRANVSSLQIITGAGREQILRQINEIVDSAEYLCTLHDNTVILRLDGRPEQ